MDSFEFQILLLRTVSAEKQRNGEWAFKKKKNQHAHKVGIYLTGKTSHFFLGFVGS